MAAVARIGSDQTQQPGASSGSCMGTGAQTLHPFSTLCPDTLAESQIGNAAPRSLLPTWDIVQYTTMPATSFVFKIYLFDKAGAVINK